VTGPPEAAFAELGEAIDSAFVLPVDARDVDAVIRRASFWRAFIELSVDSGVAAGDEPVVRVEGVPTMTLLPREGDRVPVDAGLLLIEPLSVAVVLNRESARQSMRPIRVAVECRVNVRPDLAWLDEETPAVTHVLAAGLRADGRSVAGDAERRGDLPLRRADGPDPVAALPGGVGRLRLTFDLVDRVAWTTPAQVGNVRALVRALVVTRWTTAEAPVGDEVDLRLGDLPATITIDRPREGVVSLTARVTRPREVGLRQWLQAYHFLSASPPVLLADDVPLERTGLIVVGEPGGDVMPDGTLNPLSVGSYRVVVFYREPADLTADVVRWTHPAQVEERRATVVWTRPIDVVEQE
jgi:hypothetical protein